MRDLSPRPATSSRSRPRPSTSCAPCSPSGCGGRCATPTTTSPTTGRRSTRRGSPRRHRDAGRPGEAAVHGQGHLRDNYPFGMFAVPREQVVRIHASSGTTGKPTVVGYTPTTSTCGPTVMARSIRAAGGRPARSCTTPTATACSPAASARTTAPRARLHRGARLRRDDRAPGAADQRLRARPHHGHAVVHAGDHRRDGGQGIDPRTTSLKVGIFGAEPWTDDMRREIEERLDMHAVDIYGLSEVIGPGVARSASRPRTGCTSGRTTSTRRSSTR